MTKENGADATPGDRRRGVLSPNAHGYMEPCVALALGASPWILGFEEVAVARNTALAAAGVMLVVGSTTKWKPSFHHLIPLRVHFVLDLMLGAGLLVATAVLGVWGEDRTAAIDLTAFGVLVVTAAMMTRWDDEAFDFPHKRPSTVQDGSEVRRTLRKEEPQTEDGSLSNLPDERGPISDPDAPSEWPDPAGPERGQDRGSRG